MSLPIVLAAKIFNIKIILIEPNSIIGRSNKFLLKFSNNIFCYDENISNNNYKNLNKRNTFIKDHKKVTIDPLLNKCFYLNKDSSELRSKTLKILIIGGSQASLFFSKNIGFIKEPSKSVSLFESNNLSFWSSADIDIRSLLSWVRVNLLFS